MLNNATDNSGNPQDILEVINIDTHCNLNDPEVHPNGNQTFVVYFDGIPHSVGAGKTRLFPRYLANHFAKHLADHVLTAQGTPITHPKKRPELISQILHAVVEEYHQAPTVSEGDRIAQEVDERNTAYEKVEDGGIAPDPTGVTVEEPVQVQDEEVTEKPTRKELMAELDSLGVAYSKTDTVEELTNKIRQFAGV